MYDAILQRYHNIDFVLQLPIEDFISQMAKLNEKLVEEKTWELWLTAYPHMTKESYISFENMLQQIKTSSEHKEQTDVNGCFIDQLLI